MNTALALYIQDIHLTQCVVHCCLFSFYSLSARLLGNQCFQFLQITLFPIHRCTVPFHESLHIHIGVNECIASSVLALCFSFP